MLTHEWSHSVSYISNVNDMVWQGIKRTQCSLDRKCSRLVWCLTFASLILHCSYMANAANKSWQSIVYKPNHIQLFCDVTQLFWCGVGHSETSCHLLTITNLFWGWPSWTTKITSFLQCCQDLPPTDPGWNFARKLEVMQMKSYICTSNSLLHSFSPNHVVLLRVI